MDNSELRFGMKPEEWQADVIVEVNHHNHILHIHKCRGNLGEVLQAMWVHFPRFRVIAFGILYVPSDEKRRD